MVKKVSELKPDGFETSTEMKNGESDGPPPPTPDPMDSSINSDSDGQEKHTILFINTFKVEELSKLYGFETEFPWKNLEGAFFTWEAEFPLNVESSWYNSSYLRKWKEKTKLYVTISGVTGDYLSKLNGKHEINTKTVGGLSINSLAQNPASVDFTDFKFDIDETYSIEVFHPTIRLEEPYKKDKLDRTFPSIYNHGKADNFIRIIIKTNSNNVTKRTDFKATVKNFNPMAYILKRCGVGKYKSVEGGDCQDIPEAGCGVGKYKSVEGGDCQDIPEAGCGVGKYQSVEGGDCQDIPEAGCGVGKYQSVEGGECQEVPKEGCGVGQYRAEASENCKEVPKEGCGVGKYRAEASGNCKEVPKEGCGLNKYRSVKGGNCKRSS